MGRHGIGGSVIWSGLTEQSLARRGIIYRISLSREDNDGFCELVVTKPFYTEVRPLEIVLVDLLCIVPSWSKRET